MMMTGLAFLRARDRRGACLVAFHDVEEVEVVVENEEAAAAEEVVVSWCACAKNDHVHRKGHSSF